jgi:post-segregation antitoxin (ccd killing protein)
LAVRRQTITIDPTVYDEFIKIAEKKGLNVSTWVNSKMKEFIEAENELEEQKNNSK